MEEIRRLSDERFLIAPGLAEERVYRIQRQVRRSRACD